MILGATRRSWKVFAALALMLPLGAFVAGNLVASAADDPAPRDTIIIDSEQYAVRRPVAKLDPDRHPQRGPDARREPTTTGATRRRRG